MKGKKAISVLLFFLMILLINQNQSLATNAGTRAGSFLKLSVGARYLAMGQIGTALVDDADATYWNPARLAMLKDPSLSLMHHSYVNTIRYQSLSYAIPRNRLGAFGVSIQSLRTETLDRIDGTGQRIGHFSPRDTSTSLSWATPLFGNGAVGASAKRVQSEIANTAHTHTFDVGFAYGWEKASLAFTAHNLGGELKFDKEASSLDHVFRTGWAVQMARPFLFSVETTFPNDEDATIGAGSEYKLFFGRRLTFSFRAGYSTRYKDLPGLRGLTLGGGWRWPLFELNYAWVPLGDIEGGQTQSVSLLYRFSDRIPVAPTQPPQQELTDQNQPENVEEFLKTSLQKITVLESKNRDHIQDSGIQRKLERNTVFMEQGQSHFTDINLRKLEGVARILIRNPSVKIEIEGHAVSKQGSYESNRLSNKWAELTKKYLVLTKGIEADRLQIRAYSSRRPIRKRGSVDNQRINNRIEFRRIQ